VDYFYLPYRPGGAGTPVRGLRVVKRDGSGTQYLLTPGEREGDLVCTCPAYEKAGSCKHGLALGAFIRLFLEAFSRGADL
jgi:hypothetical protein